MKPSASLSGVGKREKDPVDPAWKKPCLGGELGVAAELVGVISARAAGELLLSSTSAVLECALSRTSSARGDLLKLGSDIVKGERRKCESSGDCSRCRLISTSPTNCSGTR